MRSKTLKLVTASLLLLEFVVGVQAATITSCTLDRDFYQQGDVGYVLLTVYNDEDDTIRVTEVTARIDYFYTTGTAFSQTFYTNTTLPVEILRNQSGTFYIPFSLPTNIGSGYTRLFCRAKTDLWNNQSQIWFQSDFPTADPVLYVESPYKELLEQEQIVNEELQDQLAQQQNTISQLEEKVQTLQTSYSNTALAMYILMTVAIALIVTTAFLLKHILKPKILRSSAPQ